MTAGGEETPRTPRLPWDLPELIGFALIAVLLILIVTSIAGAISYELQAAPGDLPAGILASEALLTAASWASPWSTALMILGSLGMAWWQIDSYTTAEGEVPDPASAAHLRRATLLIRTDLVLSLAAAVFGLGFLVGDLVNQDPFGSWGRFFNNLGLTLGAEVIAVVGALAARRLLPSIPSSESTVAGPEPEAD